MSKPITTTLNIVRDYLWEDNERWNAMYGHLWEKLLEYLGKTEADDEPLKFSDMAKALQMRCVADVFDSILPSNEPALNYFVADVAERVSPIFTKRNPGNKPLVQRRLQAIRDTAGKSRYYDDPYCRDDCAISELRESFRTSDGICCPDDRGEKAAYHALCCLDGVGISEVTWHACLAVSYSEPKLDRSANDAEKQAHIKLLVKHFEETTNGKEAT